MCVGSVPFRFIWEKGILHKDRAGRPALHMNARDLIVEVRSERDTLSVSGENVDTATLEVVRRAELNSSSPLFSVSQITCLQCREGNLQPQEQQHCQTLRRTRVSRRRGVTLSIAYREFRKACLKK